MLIADWTDQLWLQIFNEVGQAIFGMTAQQLHNMEVSSYRFGTRSLLVSVLKCLDVNSRRMLVRPRRLFSRRTARRTTSRVAPSKTTGMYVVESPCLCCPSKVTETTFPFTPTPRTKFGSGTE